MDKEAMHYPSYYVSQRDNIIEVRFLINGTDIDITRCYDSSVSDMEICEDIVSYVMLNLPNKISLPLTDRLLRIRKLINERIFEYGLSVQ
jgi:hypothetical protein